MKAQVSDLTARLNAIERPGTGGGESRVLQTNSHTEIQLGQTDSTFVQRCLAESQKCPSSPASSGIASPLSEVKAITVPPASDIQAEEGHAALKQDVEGIKEKSVLARAAVEACQAVIKANAEANKAHVRGDGQGAC